MEDIKFASSTSEGEYRAKAAKLKLPMSGKKNNKFRNNDNKPKEEIKELEVIQEEKLEIIENPSLEAQTEAKEVQEEKDNKKKNSRKPKFDKRGTKKKVDKELADENLAQTVLTEGAEIEPIIPEQKNETVEEKVEQVENTEEKPKKQTRSKRPNRNTQKKPRTTKKSTKKDE